MADSLGPLRDWASGDEIAATDMQAMADRLRGFPITFSGDVVVSRGSDGSIHVFVRPSVQPPPQLPLLRVQSAAAGDGAYIMQRVVKPTGTISASAGVTAANLGDVDGVDVVAWNLDEKDEAMHWLTDPANVNKTDFQALALWGVDEDGRTVYLIDSSYSAECEEAP